VVIPAYNAERWIGETLVSVLTQTLPPMEIIVVDDGSTDGTSSLVQRYGSQVRYLYQENQGAGAARNAGMRAASGQYIAFVDADDLWKPEKLALQVDKITQGYDWVICDYICFDDATYQPVKMPRLYLYEGDVLVKLFQVNFIGSPTPVVKREIFERVGVFDASSSARIGEDWEMWLRIAAKYPLGVVRQKLAYRRIHASSLMASTDVYRKLDNLTYIIESSAAREPARLMKIKPRALANKRYGFGVALFNAERFTEAKPLFVDVLRSRPFHFGAMAYLAVLISGPSSSKSILRLKRRLF